VRQGTALFDTSRLAPLSPPNNAHPTETEHTGVIDIFFGTRYRLLSDSDSDALLFFFLILMHCSSSISLFFIIVRVTVLILHSFEFFGQTSEHSKNQTSKQYCMTLFFGSTLNLSVYGLESRRTVPVYE
jgi:hypothetical protein